MTRSLSEKTLNFGEAEIFELEELNTMSDFNPLVSIIIPVYNGSNYMKEAIDSALVQTYKNIEVIIVNDGSTDNTDEIARSYGDKIRYFKKENGGVATALNLAIENANGEYISWLSHDDIYFENKIEAQIKELEKLEDKNTILYSYWIGLYEPSKDMISCKFQNESNKNKLDNTLYPVLFGLVHGCTLLIPKICFEKIGYFDTALRTKQDTAFWYKLFPKFNVHFMPQELVKYRFHAQQDSEVLKHIDREENLQFFGNIIETISNDEIDKMYNSRMEFWFEFFERFNFGNYTTLQIKMLRKIIEHIASEKPKVLITAYVKTANLCKLKRDIRLFVRFTMSFIRFFARLMKNGFGIRF